MPKKGERKCRDCGTFFDPDYDSHYWTFDGHVVCEGCYESAEQYHSTLYSFTPNPEEATIASFDEDFVFYEYTMSDHDSTYYEEYQDLPTPIKKKSWVRTDAWRGYTTFEFEEGYVKYSDGWTTGWPDETVNRKADFNEFMERCINQELVPPVPFYMVTSVTSNVFSTAIDIVVHKANYDEFVMWLAEENGKLDEQLG